MGVILMSSVVTSSKVWVCAGYKNSGLKPIAVHLKAAI